MLRVILEPAAFFAAPFIVYVLYLIATSRKLLDADHWTQTRVAGLAIAGLVLAIGGVLAFGLIGQRHVGAYTPAHIENGTLVPGKIE